MMTSAGTRSGWIGRTAGPARDTIETARTTAQKKNRQSSRKADTRAGNRPSWGAAGGCHPVRARGARESMICVQQLHQRPQSGSAQTPARARAWKSSLADVQKEMRIITHFRPGGIRAGDRAETRQAGKGSRPPLADTRRRRASCGPEGPACCSKRPVRIYRNIGPIPRICSPGKFEQRRPGQRAPPPSSVRSGGGLYAAGGSLRWFDPGGPHQKERRLLWISTSK